MNKTKSFDIPKHLVWEAYQRVKRKKGAAGIDGITLTEFDKNLKDNLYKLWNRLSSGSYFPPPVMAMEIPKKDGGKRALGIPTVSDRIAQMAVTIILSKQLEPYFDEDSYGYRENRSALDAVKQARERCWKSKWVVDVDIKGFFDNLDHGLLIKALKRHTDNKWVLLYVERWLKAQTENSDGTITVREKGSPQGGVISPVLANLFMHYAFDKWMRRHYPEVEFERYADDIVVHCKTEKEARLIKHAIAVRLEECHLSLNEKKSKIVFCGIPRAACSGETAFDFLGFTFRMRKCKSREGKYFLGFVPAISTSSKEMIRATIRGWKLKKHVQKTLKELAEWVNPVLRGWYNYYGKFYRSEVDRQMHIMETHLKGWARNKFRTRTGFKNKKVIREYLGKSRKFHPTLFEHWKYGLGSPIG